MTYTNAIAILNTFTLSDRYTALSNNEERVLKAALEIATPSAKPIITDLLTNTFSPEHNYTAAMIDEAIWLWDELHGKRAIAQFAKALEVAFKIVMAEVAEEDKAEAEEEAAATPAKPFVEDYRYTSKANPFHYVKLTLDGAYVEVGAADGDEVTEDTLKAMANMDDLKGFILS